MRVALYARVSTSRQAQAQTIDQQLERLQAHAQAQGEMVAERAIFRDAGYCPTTKILDVALAVHERNA